MTNSQAAVEFINELPESNYEKAIKEAELALGKLKENPGVWARVENKKFDIYDIHWALKRMKEVEWTSIDGEKFFRYYTYDPPKKVSLFKMLYGGLINGKR